jgi:amidase
VLAQARVALAGAGAVVTDAEPDLADADEVFLVLRGVRMAGSHGELLKTSRAGLKDTLVWNIEQGLALTAAEIAGALRRRSAIFSRMRAFLRSFDVLALPTVQVAPFPVEVEWPASVNGVPQRNYVDWLRSCSRITVTAHPAVSVPAGFTADGLPVGLQLVGRYGTDENLLSIAAAVADTILPALTPPALTPPALTPPGSGSAK